MDKCDFFRIAKKVAFSLSRECLDNVWIIIQLFDQAISWNSWKIPREMLLEPLMDLHKKHLRRFLEELLNGSQNELIEMVQIELKVPKRKSQKILE